MPDPTASQRRVSAETIVAWIGAGTAVLAVLLSVVSLYLTRDQLRLTRRLERPIVVCTGAEPLVLPLAPGPKACIVRIKNVGRSPALEVLVHGQLRKDVAVVSELAYTIPPSASRPTLDVQQEQEVELLLPSLTIEELQNTIEGVVQGIGFVLHCEYEDVFGDTYYQKFAGRLDPKTGDWIFGWPRRWRQ